MSPTTAGSVSLTAPKGSPGRPIDPIPRGGDWLILGKDPKILAIRQTVARVADTDATVLIQGESGTGKELVARSIHQMSSRRDAAFVAVNCGAVPDSLLESEIFGHSRGAFTGADVARVGRFEAADHGTIFLDELSEMSRALQVALLRLLQFGEYTPVGTVASRYTDARVIAATNCDLGTLMDSGRFRHDLYYRLNIIRVELPPLRERPADIPALIDHFLRLFSTAYAQSGAGRRAGCPGFLAQLPLPGQCPRAGEHHPEGRAPGPQRHDPVRGLTAGSRAGPCHSGDSTAVPVPRGQGAGPADLRGVVPVLRAAGVRRHRQPRRA